MGKAERIINNAANRRKEKADQEKRKAPSVRMNSNLDYIDHIWAKNGEVYWKTREGHVDHMSPNEAIHTADQINRDITKFAKRPDVGNVDQLKRKRDEMVDKLLKAYRKAGQQRKNPDNKADELLSYAWHGKNRRGEPFTAAMTFNDQVLEQKKKEYPYLNEQDIVQFLRSPNLSPQEAERMLAAENGKREMQHKDPEAAKQVAI